MKNKKNIDELFGGLKNFDASPSPEVWKNIQAELSKKKKDRKVIPLWIKYGGIAALLAILITIGSQFYDFNSIKNNPVTHREDQNIEPLKKEMHIKKDIAPSTPTNDIVSTEKTSLEEENSTKKTGNQNNTSKSSETVRIASSNKTNTENDKSAIKNKGKEHVSEVKIATIDRAKYNSGEGADKSKNIRQETLEKENPQILEVIKNSEVASENKNRIKEEAPDEINPKKSILDAIAEQEKAKDEELMADDPQNSHRWNVTPNIAPVYYSSLGNGSSIDPNFNHNPKKGDVNMSYGVQVSYAINDKLSVRTGINNVDLSYSTSDIIIGMGPAAAGLRSVDYGGKVNVVTAINKELLNHPQNGYANVTLKSTSPDAKLIQSIRYLEVPFEVKYSLLDTKVGLNLIGGVSTLFLGENEVSVRADNFNSVLGEANNLSSVSFSTNIGFGVDYKLSKRFKFNIEPMFKYQLNPYTDSSVHYKPYYLGVYSGLSFKF